MRIEIQVPETKPVSGTCPSELRREPKVYIHNKFLFNQNLWVDKPNSLRVQ